MILEKALASDEAEMISVIGRYRIGKNYLVRTVYKKQIVFEISGLQNAPGAEQLRTSGTKKHIFLAMITALGMD